MIVDIYYIIYSIYIYMQNAIHSYRSGVSLEKLDELSVIHVSGTKGKGSTCAFCESILRHHGYKTGFYSSPHLVAVRERIRINGQPLSQRDFARYFWRVYNSLTGLMVWDILWYLSKCHVMCHFKSHNSFQSVMLDLFRFTLSPFCEPKAAFSYPLYIIV
jgi:hypothetical protein